MKTLRPVRGLSGRVSSPLLPAALFWALAPLSPAVAQSRPAAPSTPIAPGSSAEVIALSPFHVNTERDTGFAAINAGTATRLALDIQDLPAAYSVMTREFIDALGITNAQDAMAWSTNGAPREDPNSQDALQQPTQANLRGLGTNAGQQRNNYLTGGILDAYSLERYDFGRGPNAALFNIGSGSALGGGMGAQTKRARYDRAFDTIAFTYGSWDYQRATVDVNRPLTDRLAVRLNGVVFDKGGWRLNDYEKTRGLTATASYLRRPQTELRVEGAYDRIERTTGAHFISDMVSGWDGVTVFRGPITNDILGTQTAPGVPNALGHVLRFQGEAQGINRRNGEYYVWSPYSGQNLVMNYQNEGITRRADDTANVPLLANGVLYTRGAGQPFGTHPGTGQPVVGQVFGEGENLLYRQGLPDDLFARALAGSKFRLPAKDYTTTFDGPVLTQTTRDANFALTHQIGQRLFFELGGNINQVRNRSARNPVTQAYLVRIDVNQVLPNGATNPNFLQAYVDSPLESQDRDFDNRSLRGNVAFKHDAGKWGDWLLNLNVATSVRTTVNTTRRRSMATQPDKRMWQSTSEQIRVRRYLSDPTRPFDEALVPTSLSRNVFAANNNTFSTTTETIAPRWVYSEWNVQDENFDNAVLATSGKFLGGKLVLLGVGRYDRFNTTIKSRLEYGDLPADWDGTTFLYKPQAPADWAQLSYLPRNATTGVATATRPIPAVTRPRQNAPGVTNNFGVQIWNPFFATDRFRNDYSPPPNKGEAATGSGGFVYHLHKLVSVSANYATSYAPPPTNAFTLTNEVVKPQTGFGYDAGLRFRLLGDRIAINTNYYYNEEKYRRTDPPVKSSINSLVTRNAATDASTDGRNLRGVPDIIGTDYASLRTSGVELEVVGQLARGWRAVLNAGTARVYTFNRWPLAKQFVPENAELYRQVLEDAGGRIDPAQPLAGAPGRAVVNPAVTAAIPAEQANAVADYNNIWTNYALVLNDVAAVGQDRLTVNVFSDYTIASGRLRGLRVGLGAQHGGRIYVGSRSGDTIVDPANPTRAIDDPRVDITHPIYVNRPIIATATLGYALKLRGWKRWDGKDVTFQLTVRNLTNTQKVIYTDSGVALRPPGGDFTQPNRVAVPGRPVYTEPISFLFTTTLKL